MTWVVEVDAFGSGLDPWTGFSEYGNEPWNSREFLDQVSDYCWLVISATTIMCESIILIIFVLVAGPIWYWVKKRKVIIQVWQSVGVQLSLNGRMSGTGGCVASNIVHASANKLLHSQNTHEKDLKRMNKCKAEMP